MLSVCSNFLSYLEGFSSVILYCAILPSDLVGRLKGDEISSELTANEVYTLIGRVPSGILKICCQTLPVCLKVIPSTGGEPGLKRGTILPL